MTFRPGSHSLSAGVPPWTFLTNHAHVLLCITQDPEILLRDLAFRVGITERAVQRIIAELVEAGYLRSERSGRRNRYQVRSDAALRHPLESHCSVAELLRLLSRRSKRQIPAAVRASPVYAASRRLSTRSEARPSGEAPGSSPRRRSVLKSAADRWPDEGLVFE